MSKEEWLNIKKSNNYPVNLFWEYFEKFNTGKEMTEEEFRVNFQAFMQVSRVAPVSRLSEYFDQKLGVTKLLTKEGILIKEY